MQRRSTTFHPLAVSRALPQPIPTMNKAFIREPEDTGQWSCPRCGSLGIAVHSETLAAHLSPEARKQVADAAYFCPFPRCEVAYFDAFERVVPVEALGKPVYPKDPSAAICSCFGLTLDDIEQDLAEGGVRRVKELLAKAKGPAAHCSTASPSGQSCIAEVQRAYMQRRSEKT
jgi:hypothetical protein